MAIDVISHVPRFLERWTQPYLKPTAADHERTYGESNNPTNVVVGWIVDKSNSTRMTSAYVKEVE